MIATLVLAILLVLVTAMMIGISNLYKKGSTQASLQDSIRSTSDEIAQDLQLNGSALVTSPNTNPALPRSYCIGTIRYTYILGKQISSSPGPSQSYHVLWRDSVPSGTCPDIPAAQLDSPTPTPPATDPGTELVGPDSLLTNFVINNTNGLFTITIGEAYGSNSLLCDSGTAGDCSSISTSTHVWDPNAPTGTILCKGQDGNQFCSTETLTTNITERL